MNTHRTDAVLSPQDSNAPDSFLRQILRLLLKGPADLTSPAARWAVTLLTVVGAVLAIRSAWIHLLLWNDGYKDIVTIGPLFLIQGIATIVIALVMVIFRRLVLLAVGAVTLAATAVGLLLSVHLSLFGYKESLSVPYATESLWEEFAGAGVLLLAAGILLVWPRRPPANP